MTVARGDAFGLVHASVDVHTLGMISFRNLLDRAGIESHIADDDVAADVEAMAAGHGGGTFRRWLEYKRITVLGFSYRLDPGNAVRIFAALHEFMSVGKLFSRDGGKIRGIYFAGLPLACKAIRERFPDVAGVFMGDEEPPETLALLGLRPEGLARAVSGGLKYDSMRLDFGRSVVSSGAPDAIRPVDRSGYAGFGTASDRVENRVRHGLARRLPPLMRAHAGPYLPDRKEAVKLFLEWTRSLAASGLLDVLSIGTSQLTQSRFGEDWDGLENGGGVPIATPEEYAAVRDAARPMLVRTYAGTKDILSLARMHERYLDIAWHALSFWWFSRLDGRGPNTVASNLEEHFRTLEYIASTGKAFEPNVPHHFAFRGCDDLGFVLSGYVAARAARNAGIGTLILQVMLNTPKYTSGTMDLAKARALLRLVRSLEGPGFRVLLQPRSGLDYFSPDSEKAKAQLAAVTALMDDIEPNDDASPPIIHVVSYSEGSGLATPPVIDESIRITRAALSGYRKVKDEGGGPDGSAREESAAREETLVRDAHIMLHALEDIVPDLWTARGFHTLLRGGVFPLPWLTYCKDEYPEARIGTTLVNGGIDATDDAGAVLSVRDRIAMARRAILSPRGEGA